MALRQAYRAGEISKSDFIRRMFDAHKSLYDYAPLIAASDLAEVAISAEGITYTTRDGVKIFSQRPDQRLMPLEVLNFGSYEPQETRALLDVIRDGDHVLDVGGNIGWFAVLIAKKFPAARVSSFEPVEPVFRELVANVELNGCSNVACFNVALSDKAETFEIFYDPAYSARSSARDLSGGESSKIKCSAVVLDRFAKEQDLPPVQVIKCDVEGAELFALKGGIGLIDRDRPAVFAEMLRKWSAKFGYHPNDIINLLVPLGYVCFDISGDEPTVLNLVDEETKGTNFMFLHQDKHADQIARWARAR